MRRPPAGNTRSSVAACAGGCQGRYLLFATRYSLVPTTYSLLLSTYYSQLTAHCSQLTTYYVLLTDSVLLFWLPTHYSLLATHYSLARVLTYMHRYVCDHKGRALALASGADCSAGIAYYLPLATYHVPRTTHHTYH